MPFSPTLTHESKAVPGLTFTVHRLGLGRRTDIDFQTLAFRQRMRELEADYPPASDQEQEIQKQIEIAKKKALAVPDDQFDAVMKKDVEPLGKELDAAIPPEVKKRRAVIDEEYGQVDLRIRAAWIRNALISIDQRTNAGPGELDGMTADQLLDYGPPALAQEIFARLQDDGRLVNRKNLSSGTISGGAVAGESPSTTVQFAEVPPEVGTLTATASSTSPGT